MAEQKLKVPTNSFAEVQFGDIKAAARFANVNARRVSNTLELLAKGDHDGAQLSFALELLTDVAYQVAGAVEILADTVESKGGAGHG